jgi:hypothetical protein
MPHQLGTPTKSERDTASKSVSSADRRARIAALRQAAEQKERRRRLIQRTSIGAIATVLVGGLVAIGVLTVHHGPPPAATDRAVTTLAGPAGPEGIVLEQGTPLAPAGAAATGRTVDGIRCETSEQVAYHIHAHLTIYVDGAQRAVPAGVGVVRPTNEAAAGSPEFDGASNCYYWMHTHAQDGVIHVEAPTDTTYTLGDFFALWNQPLGVSRVGPARGTVTAYVGGSPYHGDPAKIPLTSREDIQLDVGTVVAPRKVDWSRSQL